MALPQPFGKDAFELTLSDGFISVLFKPTRTHFFFTPVTDRAERAQFGALHRSCRIERQGHSAGDLYDEAEIERERRRRAPIFAEKFRAEADASLT